MIFSHAFSNANLKFQQAPLKIKILKKKKIRDHVFWILKRFGGSFASTIKKIFAMHFCTTLLYIHCQKITFSTVEIRLSQLFPNIVPTLVINNRSPTLDQHLTDCHSRQSVMISNWDTEKLFIAIYCIMIILKNIRNLGKIEVQW